MDEKLKGQIAHELLKLKLRKEDIKLSPEIRREVGHIVQKTGLKADDIMEYLELIIRELVDEMFASRPK